MTLEDIIAYLNVDDYNSTGIEEFQPFISFTFTVNCPRKKKRLKDITWNTDIGNHSNSLAESSYIHKTMWIFVWTSLLQLYHPHADKHRHVQTSTLYTQELYLTWISQPLHYKSFIYRGYLFIFCELNRMPSVQLTH